MTNICEVDTHNPEAACPTCADGLHSVVKATQIHKISLNI